VRYDLHFFDPTGTVLVPEPVYLPSGVQAPSLLVSGLLAGPAPALRTVERSYFPPGTKLDLSVPVSDGVAEVPLSEEILDIDDRQLDLAMAQLAWTLRQVPGLDEMRVTVDGASIDRTTGASARSLRGWSAYDPSVPSTGLRGTAVVSVSDEVADVVTTAFRRDPIRALAVDPRGEGTVGVSSDGRRVLRAGLPAVQGRESRPRPVHNGQDVLRPAWDQFGNIWLVDRSRSGARVTVLSDGASRRLRVPGMTGQDVTAFELSRDGTRIAAVVDGQVVLARVGRQENGRPTRALRPIHIQVAGDAGRVVDLGWAAPAMLGVLTRLSPDSAQVLPAGIDGSFAVGDDATPLEPLFEAADDLVTWPGADAPVFLAAPSGRVYQASPTGRWVAAPLPPGLGALTFPG
jgi:hypothetical protein